jgi:PAS domain S-box-containing protein
LSTSSAPPPEPALEHLRALFEQASSFFWVLSPEGVLLEVNRGPLEFAGARREDVVGKPFLEGPWWAEMPPGARERLAQAVREAGQGRPSRSEVALHEAAGWVSTVELSLKPSLEAGRVRLVLAEGRDISERKRAEQARLACEAMLAGITRIAAEAIISVDDNQRILLFNEGAERIFGYSGAEMLGKPVEQLLPERLRAVHRGHMRAFAEGPGRERQMHALREIPGLRKSGEEFPAEATLSKLKVAGQQVYTIALRDISERKRREEENARLYREAQQATRARDEVLGIVAHDLRSPLGAIFMTAERIARHLELGKAGRETQESVELILRLTQRTGRLVEDLVDIARMEAGQLVVSPQRLSVQRLVAEAVEHARAAAAGVELHTEVAEAPPEVEADPHRILQVFSNLLGNAVKFSGPGGRITVGARPGGQELLFWVRDTGPGIPEEHRPHLFDRFWQARRDDRRGAGLGLTISKHLVEAHGGRIWVESTPGQGSTFWFALPVAREA